MVFGTLPDNWYVYKKYPWMRYIQVPFPLVNFIIISLLIGDTTKQQDTTSVRVSCDAPLRVVHLIVALAPFRCLLRVSGIGEDKHFH